MGEFLHVRERRNENGWILHVGERRETIGVVRFIVREKRQCFFFFSNYGREI